MPPHLEKCYGHVRMSQIKLKLWFKLKGSLLTIVKIYLGIVSNYINEQNARTQSSIVSGGY